MFEPVISTTTSAPCAGDAQTSVIAPTDVVQASALASLRRRNFIFRSPSMLGRKFQYDLSFSVIPMNDRLAHRRVAAVREPGPEMFLDAVAERALARTARPIPRRYAFPGPALDVHACSLGTGLRRLESGWVAGGASGPIATRHEPREYGWRQSITRSARSRTDSGIVKPILFAAVRLIVNSNLVGFCTGKLAGLAPFKIRST